VGNSHGDYKFPPKLDFDRISDISKETGLPLVLHGGSGLSENDFRMAVKRGICKINIFTDIDKAGKNKTVWIRLKRNILIIHNNFFNF
jgi:fructose-bisphosphate aldolase class II